MCEDKLCEIPVLDGPEGEEARADGESEMALELTDVQLMQSNMVRGGGDSTTSFSLSRAKRFDTGVAGVFRASMLIPRSFGPAGAWPHGLGDGAGPQGLGDGAWFQGPAGH